MIITISNDIKMIQAHIPSSIQRLIVNELTLDNPAYQQAIKYGKRSNHIPREIKLFRSEGPYVVLPRGYGARLIRLLKEKGIAYEIEDCRLKLSGINFQSAIKLREYQQPAVEKIVYYRQGGIVAPCGAGKTAILLEAIAEIGQPTLWITHSKELADQVMTRAVEFLNIPKSEIGLIGSGKCRVGDRLTVALVQTLSKMDLSTIADRFGAVFVDEAHHLAAASFFHPVGQFPALYRIWASATPKRADGLTEMIFAAGGPILHEIYQNEVPTIIPELQVIETDYNFFEEDYPKLINHLVRDDQRNDLIVKTIVSEANGNYCLVLSDRIEHLEILKMMLQWELPGHSIEILTGNLKAKERQEIMDRVQAKEVDILLATQLAREGLDITHLNRLFLTTPKRAASAVQQEVGRVMRPCEGKTDAIVFDFWDNKNPMLKAQFWKRREVYRKIGMEWPPKSTQIRGGPYG